MKSYKLHYLEGVQLSKSCFVSKHYYYALYQRLKIDLNWIQCTRITSFYIASDKPGGEWRFVFWASFINVHHQSIETEQLYSYTLLYFFKKHRDSKACSRCAVKFIYYSPQQNKPLYKSGGLCNKCVRGLYGTDGTGYKRAPWLQCADLCRKDRLFMSSPPFHVPEKGVTSGFKSTECTFRMKCIGLGWISPYSFHLPWHGTTPNKL